MRNSLLKYQRLAYFGVALSIVIGFFVVFNAYQIYRSSENSAIQSCILSVKQSLAETLKKEEVSEIINLSEEWKVLNKNEQAFLFNSVEKSNNLDCERFAHYTKGQTQSGTDLHISVRQNYGQIDVVIEREE